MLHKINNFYLTLLPTLIMGIATMMNANNRLQFIVGIGILYFTMFIIALRVNHLHSHLFSFQIIPLSLILISISSINSFLYYERIFPQLNLFFLASSIVIRIFFFSYACCLMIFVLISAKKVKSETILAAICGYLLIGIIWSFLYLIFWEIDPHAFHLTIAREYQYKPWNLSIYFSFSTLTTLGYGDIIPIDRWVMFLANMEAVLGSFYLAIVVARLVSIYDLSKEE
ncbi:MAG: two pore domain potassium channel family protein [Snowella sp.]|jgi:hypothetical protein|nr:MAG: two pore domain potassium channel family protein [Snowella sp.]